jgi:hypothetical protein
MIPESDESSNDPPTPEGDALQKLVAETHRRTMERLSNYRVIREKQRQLDLPPDKRTVDASFQLLVEKIVASRVPD